MDQFLEKRNVPSAASLFLSRRGDGLERLPLSSKGAVPAYPAHQASRTRLPGVFPKLELGRFLITRYVTQDEVVRFSRKMRFEKIKAPRSSLVRLKTPEGAFCPDRGCGIGTRLA